MGFEPHDLRVMSPTSYQAALPRDIKFVTRELPSPFITLRVIATRRHRRIVASIASQAHSKAPCFGRFRLPKTIINRFCLRYPTSYQAALPRDTIDFLLFPVLLGAGSRGRTGTIFTYHGILSPGRLPIPPFRQNKAQAEPSQFAFVIIPRSCPFVNPFSDNFIPSDIFSAPSMLIICNFSKNIHHILFIYRGILTSFAKIRTKPLDINPKGWYNVFNNTLS